MLPDTFYAPTDDGWRIALHHWPHRGGRKQHPVILLHGLGANRLHFDLDDHYSLARAAAARGFDAYILELRGSGMSRAPGGRSRQLFQWGFADHAERDVPAAIACVLDHAGADALHGIGHSMGGMLLYAQGTRPDPRLQSITTIGTPLVEHLDLGLREKRLLQLATKLTPGASQRRVPLRRLMGAAGRFIPLTSKIADGILLNAANVDNEIMARMAREAIHDVPVQVLVEIASRMAGEPGVGVSSPYDFEGRLGQIAVPVFALSGSVDRVAPVSSVRAAVARIASGDVRYREMGRSYGDRADYGHVDLLVGRDAPEEVYPTVLDFLEEVD